MYFYGGFDTEGMESLVQFNERFLFDLFRPEISESLGQHINGA
jgi:hypothetical protein